MSELEEQLLKVATTPDPRYAAELDDWIQAGSRVPAAVCVLFDGPRFMASRVLLTLRSGTVATHAYQVAFPGGTVDPQDQDDFARTAARECQEEVGIRADWIRSQGVLSPFPTIGGNFLVHPVLAVLEPGASKSEEWVLNPNEVLKAEWVEVTQLIESRQVEERTVLGKKIQAPFFRWGPHKMWGLSAWIFDSILNRYAKIKT